MAIQLPRAGAGSVGTGGARRPARLPDAGDVPAQAVANDPGVRIPDLNGAGLSSLGAGITEFGEGLQERDDRLAAADERINKRRESVERIRSGREFHDFGNQLFTEFESSRDFSRQEDAEEFGTMLNAKAAEIVAAHQGSEESRLRLMERLGPILEKLTDRAGVASVKAQDALVGREFDEITNGLAARVRLGEDPRVLISEGMTFLEAEKDALRPGQETTFVRNLTARVWGAKIDDFMAKGALEDAEEMLRVPEVRAAVGQEVQKRTFDRIAKVRTEGKAKILTPGELAEMGFPPETIAAGLVVQTKADGSTNVVFNPPAEVDEKVREKRIKAIEDQLVRTGSDPEEARDRATNLVDGNIRIEIVPGLGVAREINDLTGEVREVPLGQDSPGQEASSQETLFEVAERGNIAGVSPAIEQLVGRTVGQVFEGAVDPQLVEDRQTVKIAVQGLIKSLSLNERFIGAEQKRLLEEIEITPAVIDSTGALIARMKAIRKSLVAMENNERSAASDPNLPQTARASAAQAAKDIGNFLKQLGEPGIELPEGIPEGSVKAGVTRTGKEVWTTPEGKQLVVE